MSRFHPLAPPSSLLLRRLYGISIALWLVVITLKAVRPDEIEHAHVAWLMYERGLTPLVDFFQHHMPLLWDVLGIYHVAGGEGPYVLYFGRVLVLVCGLVTLAALHYIGRLTTPGTGALPCNGGMAGALFFLAPTTILPSLFIARPETLSTALFFASYLLWLGSWKQGARHPLMFAVLAGAFFAMANLASPRFVLLSGIYLLSINDRLKPIAFDWKRLFTLAAGALVTSMAYLAATEYSLEDVAYILSFSAMLQDVGDSPFSSLVMLYGAVLGSIGLLASIVLYRCTKQDLRRHLAVDLCYLAIVIIVSFMVAGNFVYAQDLSPVFVLGSLLLVRGYKRIEAQHEPRKLLFGSIVALLALLLLTSINSHLFLVTAPTEGHKPANLFSHMRQIEGDIAYLPRNEKVLLDTWNHLIAAEDATYYGRPLADGSDRLCRAIDAAQATWPLPDCDYLGSLMNERPYLLTKALWALGAGEELNKIESFVEKHYIECERYFVRDDQPGMRCPGET